MEHKVTSPWSHSDKRTIGRVVLLRSMPLEAEDSREYAPQDAVNYFIAAGDEMKFCSSSRYVDEYTFDGRKISYSDSEPVSLHIINGSQFYPKFNGLGFHYAGLVEFLRQGVALGTLVDDDCGVGHNGYGEMAEYVPIYLVDELTQVEGIDEENVLGCYVPCNHPYNEYIELCPKAIWDAAYALKGETLTPADFMWLMLFVLVHEIAHAYFPASYVNGQTDHDLRNKRYIAFEESLANFVALRHMQLMVERGYAPESAFNIAWRLVEELQAGLKCTGYHDALKYFDEERKPIIKGWWQWRLVNADDLVADEDLEDCATLQDLFVKKEHFMYLVKEDKARVETIPF